MEAPSESAQGYHCFLASIFPSCVVLVANPFTFLSTPYNLWRSDWDWIGGHQALGASGQLPFPASCLAPPLIGCRTHPASSGSMRGQGRHKRGQCLDPPHWPRYSRCKYTMTPQLSVESGLTAYFMYQPPPHRKENDPLRCPTINWPGVRTRPTGFLTRQGFGADTPYQSVAGRLPPSFPRPRCHCTVDQLAPRLSDLAWTHPIRREGALRRRALLHRFHF